MANLGGQANPNATRLPYTPVTAKSVTPDEITTDNYTPSTTQQSQGGGGDASTTDYTNTNTAQGSPGQGTYTPPVTTTPPATSTTTTTPSNGITGSMVNNWYQRSWGRAASADEQQYWIQNGQNAGDVESRLKNAPQATWNRTYSPIQGFDTGKLQDTSYSSPKYTDALRTFSSGLGSGIQVAQNDLGRMLNYVQLNGYPNAKVVGSDSIDFGDGNGPIDVVQANGSTWFANTTGTATPGGSSSSLGSATDTIASLLNSLKSGSGTGTTYQYTADELAKMAPSANVSDILTNLGKTDDDLTIKKTLMDLIKNGGATQQQTDLWAQLQNIINTGGEDSAATQSRLIGARESEANANTSMLADARSQLAASGLVGSPGAAQGSEGLAISKIQDQLAPTYAQAVRDINNAAADRANQNVMSAFQMATGLSQAESTALLGAVGQSTARDQLFVNTALGLLDQNRQWNTFLATYGLDRDKLAVQVQQGNTGLMISLIDEWLKGANISAGGYI